MSEKKFYVEGRWVYGYPDYGAVYDENGKEFLLADCGQPLSLIIKRIRNKLGFNWEFDRKYFSRKDGMIVLVFRRKGNRWK
jgi:hypothetical protein